VRELWAYQLAMSPLPPIPVSSLSKSPPHQTKHHEDGGFDDQDENKEEDESDSDTESASSSAAEEEDLLAALTEDGKSDEEDMRAVGGDQVQDTRWRRKRKLRASDVVVTLVLGLWILRVPVLFVTVERSAVTDEWIHCRIADIRQYDQ
jgi:RNA polymerase I-specific transcription initiation factor RRN7